MELRCIRAHLQPEQPLTLPRFTGATIRGALGFALRELVGDDGPAMALLQSRGGPSPWALQVPFAHRRFDADHVLPLRVTLVGDSCAHGNVVVQAMERLGERGLGRSRVRLRLQRIEDREVEAHTLALPDSEALRFETRSPLRLLRDRRLLWRLNPGVLLASVAKRCGEPVPRSGVVVEAQRFEGSRYQRSQGRGSRRMRLDGITGSAVLRTDDAQARRLLALGTVIHAGAATAFGFGAYALSALEA